MDNKTAVMETEPISILQVVALRKMLGMGAMLIDWDIDFDIGRGILEGDNRCFWSKDGRRITVDVFSDGGFAAAQDNEPDPVYFQLKEADSGK